MLDRPAPDAPQAAPADTAPDGEAWEAKAKNVLKAELKRRGIGYKELAEQLTAIGVSENEPNIRNKLARGRFTAVFHGAGDGGDWGRDDSFQVAL